MLCGGVRGLRTHLSCRGRHKLDQTLYEEALSVIMFAVGAVEVTKVISYAVGDFASHL